MKRITSQAAECGQGGIETHVTNSHDSGCFIARVVLSQAPMLAASFAGSSSITHRHVRARRMEEPGQSADCGEVSTRVHSCKGEPDSRVDPVANKRLVRGEAALRCNFFDNAAELLKRHSRFAYPNRLVEASTRARDQLQVLLGDCIANRV